MIKEEASDLILRTGQSQNIYFGSGEMSLLAGHSLFFTCEDRKFYKYKSEGENDRIYQMIDDSLDIIHAEYNTYCLDMTCNEPKAYSKRAAYKICWNPNDPVKASSVYWSAGIYAKAKQLEIKEGGYLRLRLEKWLVKENKDPALTADTPDETILIDIEAGTYDYKAFGQIISIDHKETACILFTVEGMYYEGEVYLERPFLASPSGQNLVPDFDVSLPGAEGFIWCGQNLSKREWPHFSISLNGEIFFDGEVFLRMHRYSPVQIDIPGGLIRKGENTISIAYKSRYHATLPVTIGEMAIIEKPLEAFMVLHCPQFAVIGQLMHVLIETTENDMVLHFKSDDFVCASSLVFKDKGLHVVSLKPIKERNELTFALRNGSLMKQFTVQRTVLHEGDSVICGSGDMIYIDNSDKKAVKEYLTWFVSNELGRLLTIRPVYHWGGQRTLNPEVWNLVVGICEEAEISYVLMSDGRDLPGIDKNPSVEELRGKGFLGRQVHERDGQLFYWGLQPQDTLPITNTFYDLAMRAFRDDPEHSEGNYNPNNIMHRDGKTSFRRDTISVADMKVAYDTATNEIRRFALDFPRHTGPSVMFKYFYEQGFPWVGAETMDGAMEAQLAFLRGASKAYGKSRTGIHHALQWSTYPHDTEQRYKRFMLANYISYMHGMTDINTEEGFWFMEDHHAYHNRFSEACARHREVQKKFHNYISTHSRTGVFYTKTAFLHGRYDGWNGFGDSILWGMANLPIGEAEDSWKLLKLFYPLNHISSTGMAKTGFIPENYDRPFGCYSGTPYGNVDVIPIENGRFSDYSLLCFAGYNAAEEGDFDRLLSFVKDGGTLVASWLHLSPTTLKADIDEKKHTIIHHELTQALSDGYPVFEKDTVSGREIKVCSNLPQYIEVIERTDYGRPLVYAVNCGFGKVILLNAFSYPGDETVFETYLHLIKELHTQCMKQENAELCCKDNVEYTVYKQVTGEEHFYITPVDWYNDSEQERKATLRVGNEFYNITLKFGVITKVIINNNVAAWVEGMEAEILKLNEGEVVVQGVDDTVLHIANEGIITDYVLDFWDTSQIRMIIN